MYQKYGKRALDFILSLGGIVCLSWLLLALAAAIKLDSPGPVFFKQKRVGIRTRPTLRSTSSAPCAPTPPTICPPTC